MSYSKIFYVSKTTKPQQQNTEVKMQICRGIILSRTRVKRGPFKIGPPVIGYIFSYNQLCEVDHH